LHVAVATVAVAAVSVAVATVAVAACPILVCNKLRHLSKVNKVTNSLNIYLQFFGLANNLCNAIFSSL